MVLIQLHRNINRMQDSVGRRDEKAAETNDDELLQNFLRCETQQLCRGQRRASPVEQRVSRRCGTRPLSVCSVLPAPQHPHLRVPKLNF